jgi:hypothetical protein
MLRRLYRLHKAPPVPDPNNEHEITDQTALEDPERERDLLKLELLKWKISTERIMASVANLERQRDTYLRRAADTGKSFKLAFIFY